MDVVFLIKNKISYTNRLRERDFIEMFEQQEAEIFEVTSILKPENVEHVKSMKVDKRFARYSPEELAVTFTEIMAGWPGDVSNATGKHQASRPRDREKIVAHSPSHEEENS